MRIALSEIETFMADHDMELYLAVFDEKSFSLCAELYGDIDAYINDNYVEEKNMEEYRLACMPNDEDGTDLSEAMCRVASEKAKKSGFGLNVFPANMIEFKSERSRRSIIITEKLLPHRRAL